MAWQMYEMMNWSYGMGFFGITTWLLFVIVLILIIIWLVKQINKK